MAVAIPRGDPRSGVFDLGDLSVKTKPVRMQRGGKSVVLRGYVEGGNCPGFVRIGVFAARDPIRALEAATAARIADERAQRLADNPGADPDEAPYAEPLENESRWERAYYEQRRDLCIAVVEGLEYHEAEVLAGNVDLFDALMRRLEWIKDPEADDDTPEAGEEVTLSTGASSSPAAAPSTSSAPMSS